MGEAVEWVETEGVVTTCVYRGIGMGVMAFGVRTQRKFRITFDYYAHGQTYSDEFGSDVAVPQGERVRVRYDPLRPEVNDLGRGVGVGEARAPRLWVVGVVGSVVLSVGWLVVLRGCW